MHLALAGMRFDDCYQCHATDVLTVDGVMLQLQPSHLFAACSIIAKLHVKLK